MKKFSFPTLLLSGLLALVLLGGLATPVSATAQTGSRQTAQHSAHPHHHPERVTKIPPIITLSKLADIKLSEPFMLGGIIKDQKGKPIANKSIIFTIDGKYLGQTRSNLDGEFERKFTETLNAGTYVIAATSKETHLLAPTTTSIDLTILPTEVQIQTIPSISGMPFQLNGMRFVSGDNGIASIEVDKPGQYRLEVLVDQYHNPDKRIEFARWLEESYQPFKDIQVPTDQVIQVGFNIYHLVGQSFIDLDGLSVDPTRVNEFTIRSAQGDMFVLHDGQPRWIPASRVARRAFGLEETKLLYSVLSVTVDGSNVVNQSQQRFYTYPVENWPISLLLYSMRISAKDGLFGSPVGKSVNLVFPDGRVLNYPLDQAGTVEIRSLARGNYFTELVGANGLNSRTPVALSRNQDVNTRVVTYLDLTVVGVLGVFIALGLLLYGRPSLLYFLRKNNQRPTQEKEWGLVPEALVGTTGQLYDYRHMRYETVKMFDDEEFKKSIGVDRDIFERMLALYQKNLRKADKRSKLSGADQILLTILYLREHRAEFEIGQIYGVSKTTVRRTVKKVKNVMMKSVDFDFSGNNDVLQSGNLLIGADLVDDSEKPASESSSGH